MPKVSFNGRFLNAPPTGVQRVARELIVSLLQTLESDQDLKQKLELSLICPPGTKDGIARTNLAVQPFGMFSGQLWEQFDLPRAKSGDLLVNLCNLSPIFSNNSITMVHDAQVFLTPESYSNAFGAWYRFVLPRIGKNARKILTVSNYSADQLVRFGVAPREKIAVVHNGVDHILHHAAASDIVARLGLTPGTYTVGLSNTQPHKNIAVLLDAYRNPRLSQSTLVLFGAADEAAFQAAGLSLPNNVILAGRLSDEELRGLLEAASALVFPSKTEGFGLPPLEAMTLGIPAICADAGALPEVGGDAALYANAEDSQDWIAQISRLAEESPESRSARAAACQAQAAKFTWAKAGEKLLALIRSELDV